MDASWMPTAEALLELGQRCPSTARSDGKWLERSGQRLARLCTASFAGSHVRLSCTLYLQRHCEVMLCNGLAVLMVQHGAEALCTRRPPAQSLFSSLRTAMSNLPRRSEIREPKQSQRPCEGQGPDWTGKHFVCRFQASLRMMTDSDPRSECVQRRCKVRSLALPRQKCPLPF